MTTGVPKISAVLLAAGESKRMGEFKQLLAFRGKTFVECCADNLLTSGADEVLVVTGHRDADIHRALSGRSVRFVHNQEYRAGMSSSIKQGVEAISPEASACLIALVDQPQVSSSVFAQVIEAYRRQTPLIAIATCEGRRGHPILLDISLRDEILRMDQSVGLKQVVQAHLENLLLVEVSTDSILIDFDLPEDYRRI